MASNTLISYGHGAGHTSLAFSRDGAYIYTGGADSIARIWRPELGTDQEPETASEAMESVTTIATAPHGWFSGSSDCEVRQYAKGKADLQGFVTCAVTVPIRCVAVDPQGARVAVSSDTTEIKVIDLKDTSKIFLLKGHTKAVRRVTWHPSGALLTSCGADGKIIVWDVSEEGGKQVAVIDGIIPAVVDPDSPEWMHDCSAIWHTSGQYFFVATRTFELVTVSRSDWKKAATFTDDSCSGAITALAMSANGVYLATASKSGVFIWSTQNRRLMYRFQGALSAPLTQMAWSPSANLLAWTNTEGSLIRWRGCVPADGLDPVKISTHVATVNKPLPPPVKRKGTPDLFDFDLDEAKEMEADPDADMEDDTGDAALADLPDDVWILDDLGDGMKDEDEKEKDRRLGGGAVREMVSVTKAQPAFQPGSTPMENRKRYLAYNMIGVIEVTDQDTHHVVNVEFHDRSTRKGYHFTDHFKYDLAALGERGAVFACPPEAEHSAQIIYKPYGTWASQSEWTYELPKGTTVLGVAAGGTPPTKSLRTANDADLQGHGNVVVATSDHELIFLTGTGIERHIMSLQGDFVTMVASPEWVFVVQREGSTTMDGSQNLTGRLVLFEDYCLLQKDTLPIPKGHTLKWIGVTEEGAPVIYDSSGVLNILPRFRIPFQATWTRILNTNVLDRREGKHESYWPVGVSGEAFMCLILKGRQEHPGFPRPLIQELPLRLPFKHTDPKDGALEEHFARETMLLDIQRDALGDELTSPDIARRELALDKELIQLIQSACKADRIARALDLTRLLHHPSSYDMAAKVAGFYHLIGLQEKMQTLRDDATDNDRLEDAREKRRDRAGAFEPVPAPRQPAAQPTRPKAFQDFGPPPTIPRPGLERVAPSEPSKAAARPARESSAPDWTRDDFQSSAPDMDDYGTLSPDGKRKRSVEPVVVSEPKRRNVGESVSARGTAQTRSNPFARKSIADNGRNPFSRGGEMNKSLHKSESFFKKAEDAETGKIKGTVKGKAKEKEKKDNSSRQTTLFGLPPVAPLEKKSATGKKKKGESQETHTTATEKSQTDESQVETQNTDVTMAEGDTQVDEEPTQVVDDDAPPSREGSEPIEWPASPAQETATLVDVSS